MEASKDASSAKTDTVSNQEQLQGNEEDTVSFKSHDKLLGQHKKTKAMLTDAMSQIETFNQQVADLNSEKQLKEEQKLIKAGEKDKIIELRESKIAELEASVKVANTKTSTLQETMAESEKLYAVLEKLPGRIKNSKYMQLIPLDEIVMDSETGKVDSQSVELVVNQFMKDMPDTVDTKRGKVLPGDAAMAAVIGANNFKDLSLKDMKANIKQAVQSAKAKIGVK